MNRTKNKNMYGEKETVGFTYVYMAIGQRRINHVLGDEMECGCTLAALVLLYFTNSLHFTDKNDKSFTYVLIHLLL